MTTFNPRWLTPPQQEEEIYPYRRVWRSIIQESSIVFAITIFLFIVKYIVNIEIPDRFHPFIGGAIALVPLLLWLYFSWWREKYVPQPRSYLLGVMLITGLSTNAIGIPIINDLFQVDKWLPLSNAVIRIIGYTFTVGVTHQIIIFVVLRYIAWTDYFRIRLDGVAYGAAAGIGYITVLNLHAIFPITPTPDSVAAQVFANLAIYLITSIFIGYGLAELRLGSPPTFLPMFTVALGALLVGLAIPIRAGLINAGLGLGISSPRPILGILFSAILFVISVLALSFTYENAERQAREAELSQEET